MSYSTSLALSFEADKMEKERAHGNAHIISCMRRHHKGRGIFPLTSILEEYWANGNSNDWSRVSRAINKAAMDLGVEEI